jgi:hypothetical protein
VLIRVIRGKKTNRYETRIKFLCLSRVEAVPFWVDSLFFIPLSINIKIGQIQNLTNFVGTLRPLPTDV